MSTRRPRLLLASSLLGLTTILTGVLMAFIFPVNLDLPPGFFTPIIAFEFAATPSDLSYLMGQDTQANGARIAMTHGLYLDMMFPFCYAGFLGLLLIRQAVMGYRVALLGLPFAVAIIPLDIRENLTLLAIIDEMSDPATLELLLAKLRIDTWLKWGAIALAMLPLGFACWRKSDKTGATLCLLAAGSILLSWGSGTVPQLAEIMGICVLLFFVAWTVRECRQLYRRAY
ncbi:MAG: hypothetical protein AAGF57_16210 [Pseudomonadota bacterium]